MLTESEVQRTFQNLFQAKDFPLANLTQAEVLLLELRAESPLRQRLRVELEELRKLRLGNEQECGGVSVGAENGNASEIERQFRAALSGANRCENVELAESLLRMLDSDSPLRLRLQDDLSAWCAATTEPQLSESQLRERFRIGGGRRLDEILTDLEKSK